MKQEYHTHITPEKRWFELNLKEVWRYRDLIWLFTKRTFTVYYKQTILGPAWIFVEPLFTSIVFTLVFGGIARIDTCGVPHILFYLCSEALWSFFSKSVSHNASTFTQNASVFGKVYFPRLTVPLSNVLSGIIQFLVQMTLVMGVLAVYAIRGQVRPNWAAWTLIPLILLHLGVMGLGFGIIVSSMTTRYRDLSIMVNFGMRLWMYATPVVYPLSQIGTGWIYTIVQLNPVTAPMELFRWAVLGVGEVSVPHLAISWGVTLLVFAFGVMLFNRIEKTFMDTI